jgi:GT2 family glycosyltransferase
MTSVAVVILNYNGEELLKKFLPSIISYSTGARIVVADNASTDQSIAAINHHFPSVEVIQLPENRGFCGGYNEALKRVSEKYCVLINSDVEVTPNWLIRLTEVMDADPNVGAVQPKILSYYHRNHFEYAGAAGGALDLLGYPFCRGRVFTELEEDKGQYNQNVQLFWASGACFMIRTELFAQMGGLDEDFFAHMEEIDFCWKLNRAGYQVRYQHLSTVYHVGGGTLAKSNPLKTYLNFRNGLSLVYKHWRLSELILKFPIRIVLDWVAGLKFLVLDKSPKDAAAVAKAHYQFIKNIQNDNRKRNQLQRDLPHQEKLPIISKSVVWAFYLQTRKTYREIVEPN